jgi:arylsulfatase A-like enzyme
MTPCTLRTLLAAALTALPSLIAAQAGTPAAKAQPHNVILFVPDGLRAASVSPDSAPTMADIRDSGVNFRNSHSLFPTLTTANASALATGHYLGDTGDWANVIDVGFPVRNADYSELPFLENDAVLGEIDEHFHGDYLAQQTLMAAAREAGYGTAAVGKSGPVLIQDHTARDGQSTIIIDDATGRDGEDAGARRGIPLAQPVKDALAAAGLSATPPEFKIPNHDQHAWFAAAFTKAVLPLLKQRGKPFYAVYWSRDPDGTQHAQTDSNGRLVPGVNGRFSGYAIQDADNDLAAIRKALDDLGLTRTTDIIIAADHGFSTISKESQTSISAKMHFDDTPADNLPLGFFATDLSRQLDLRLFDPDAGAKEMFDNGHTRRGNGVLGPDEDHAQVIVAADGGSDLIYLPGEKPAELAPKVVAGLLDEDYVSGVFVRDDLGAIPGTLPFSAIGLKGSAITPAPAMIVSFKSFSTGCDLAVLCAAEIADTNLQQGHGMHGSFSRADTDNFQAAIGPDFKTHFIDAAPSSNADIAVTIAHILNLKPKGAGKLTGRVLEEAFPGGATPVVKRETRAGPPAPGGLRTVLEAQSVGATRYFDAAGFPGRTVGLATPVR